VSPATCRLPLCSGAQDFQNDVNGVVVGFTLAERQAAAAATVDQAVFA